jgi:glucose-6-phosphate isomerase
MRIPLAVSVSDSSDDAVARLVDAKVASRIRGRDHTLWGADAEAEASKRLSWVDLAVTSRPLLAEIDALRAELWSEGVDRVVLCGMGGSSLAPEVISRTYGVPLDVLDSTNPNVVRRAVSADLSATVVVVSSKSGTTLETDSQRRAFEAAFEAAGIDPASRLVAVTDPGSELERLGRDRGFRRIFLADPGVGGRYSALSAFGLVPAGLAGVDIADLLDEAEEVMDALYADTTDNPALVLAAAWAAAEGRDKVAIADAGSGITSFPAWLEQLIAESTGKLGRGVLPVGVEGVDAPEIRWPAADVVAAAITPPSADPATPPDEMGVPWVTVSGALGAQMLLWEVGTAAAGWLLGINPFDQPDVESAKAAARGLLEAQPEEKPPALSEGGVDISGSPRLLDGVDSLNDAVDALTSELADDGYLAVMAYLDPERDADLIAVRSSLCRRTERPTTFGWGPRFLHSTGQYHKGGPPQGVFLQITCDESDDLDIPGRPFSFGTLIAAQAAGDAAVLADHGRPILRLHLRDPETGVAALVEALR